MKFLIIVLLFTVLTQNIQCERRDGPFFVCQKGRCLKTLEQEQGKKSYSFYECRMFCSGEIGMLWPKPSGPVTYENYSLPIDFSKIAVFPPTTLEWEGAKQRFLTQVSNKIPKPSLKKLSGNSLNISINYEGSIEKTLKLSLSTDESYHLSIKPSDHMVLAIITAKDYFGARHGLETLGQLLFYDDLSNELKILAEASIHDKPRYKWRGLAMDSARNFISVPNIKKIIDGMAMSKLNTFHWHMTDSQSFPFEVRSQPELHMLGAYDKKKIYSHEEIEDIVRFAIERGIRVLPEFDAPAHVGEGWQNLDVLICFNKQPWQEYCVEPPCGQFDPSNPKVYDILQKIYQEMFELFNLNIFHMGGDEVSINCWNSSTELQHWMLKQGWGLEESDFLKLWNVFQKEALRRYDIVSNHSGTPIILWTSRLTEPPYLDSYLDPNRYIIQVWTTGDDVKINELYQRGYRTIISNYDALYLDCGGPGWVTDGQNWCSPYKGWQKVYSNDLVRIGGKYSDLVLGAEAAIWTEQLDDSTIVPRIFPRISALGENLWLGGENNWKNAESRMLLHRETLVQNGIPSESLQPEWCLKYENECPIDAYV